MLGLKTCFFETALGEQPAISLQLVEAAQHSGHVWRFSLKSSVGIEVRSRLGA